MMLTSSDASSLVRELWWWEHAEYVFGALVAAACAGEYIADFNKRPWVKAHKDRIAKISTLVLVAALVFELICITRANGKSDEVISKLRDEAEAADNLAQSAVQNSNTALGTSATALSQAKDAVTKSGKAADSLGKAEAEANKAQSASSIAQQKAGQVATQADALSLTAVFLLCGSSVGGSTQPPSALSYATGTAVYTNGVLVTANIPTSTGGAVTSYSISPALPAGLSL